MISLVKQWLIPGSTECLLAGTAVAALLLLTPSERLRGWGRRLVVLLAAVYLLLSVPVVAEGLVAMSAAGFSPVQPADAEDAQAIVVLDGGAHHYGSGIYTLAVPVNTTVFRAFEALRVYRLLPDGARVVITAGGWGDESQQKLEGVALHSELVRGGIPNDRIVLDRTSRNTVEHARFLVSWLDEHHISRFVVVTSAAHIRRARLTLRAAGLDPIMSPAPMRSDTARPRFRLETASLDISRQVFYDLLGLGYYFARGFV